jgi:hypothetical protein
MDAEGCLEGDYELLMRRADDIAINPVTVAMLYSYALKRMLLDNDPLAMIVATIAVEMYLHYANDIPGRVPSYDRIFREAALEH